MFGKKKKLAKLEQEKREQEQREAEQALALAAQQAEKEEPFQEENDGKIYVKSELVNDDDDNALPKEYEAIAYILKQEEGDDLVAQPVDDDDEELELPLEEVGTLEEVKPAEETAQPEDEAQDDEIEDLPLEEIKEETATEEVQPQEEVAKEVETTSEADAVAENQKWLEEAENSINDDETEEAESLKETEPVDETSEAEEVDEEADEETEESDNAVATDESAPKEEVVYVVDGPSEDDDEIVKPAKLVKLPNLVDYMLAQNMSKQMKIKIATLLLTTYNKYKDIPAEKKIIIQCMAKVMKSLIQGN